MRHPRPLICLLLVFVGLVGAPETRGDFYLKDGDRVVFYGDSITDQRLYTTFVETYVVTRFPRRDVTFVHSGWGGDRVTGGGGGPIDRRLQRDVFAYKPTVLTIMLGMNDAGYRAFDEAIFRTYATGYERILEEVKEKLPDTRITLIQPSPFDDVTQPPGFPGGYNGVLVKYGDYLKELAQREHADLADLNTPVVTALGKAKETDAALAKKIIPDRVHPGPGGHLLMAAALLDAWDAPATVSAVAIDASGEDPHATRAENAQVTELGRSHGRLSWTQEDAALPLPIDLSDPVLALAVRSSDVMDQLNRQTLQVTGVDASKYRLEIDGQEVGTFTREVLNEGINLAERPTPMLRQAAEVHALTLLHNNAHFLRWRQLQVPLQDDTRPPLKAALAGLDALESGLVKQQRAAAQPRPHRFELIPQT
jgi:lysophospholipase L1-like esterase